jgi:hypothetical protein
LRHKPGRSILGFVPEPLPEKPPVSCLVAAWLVKTTHPVRIVTAAILDMADDGLVTVHADESGYTLRAPLDRDSGRWQQLGQGRQAILDGLLKGETEVVLPRQRDDPADDGTLRTWADGFAPARGFASHQGIFGFMLAIRYSISR